MVVCGAWQEGAGSHRQIQCALFCKVRSQGQPKGQRRIQCAAAGTTEWEGDVKTLAGCWKDGLGPAFQLEGEQGAHTDCLGRLWSLPFVSRAGHADTCQEWHARWEAHLISVCGVL